MSNSGCDNHLLFTIYPSVGQNSSKFGHVTQSWKHRNNHRNFIVCVHASWYDMNFLLPVSGRHLWWTINPNLEQSLQCSSLVMLPDSENIRLAVGVALLSIVWKLNSAFQSCRPRSWIFHFRLLPLWLYGVGTCLIGMPDPDNIGVVGIAYILLSSELS